MASREALQRAPESSWELSGDISCCFPCAFHRPNKAMKTSSELLGAPGRFLEIPGGVGKR